MLASGLCKVSKTSIFGPLEVHVAFTKAIEGDVAQGKKIFCILIEMIRNYS
jgi:hypothetical protein